MKNYTKEITFEDILESIKYLSEKERNADIYDEGTFDYNKVLRSDSIFLN